MSWRNKSAFCPRDTLFFFLKQLFTGYAEDRQTRLRFSINVTDYLLWRSPVFQSNKREINHTNANTFWNKHLDPPLMLVMGGTWQLKWKKPAATALWVGHVFQRMTNIKSTRKRWWWDKRSGSGWNNGVKGKSSDWAASWMPLWTLDSTAPKRRRRGTDRKDLTRYLSLCDVMEISADLAGDSENWCVTIATASSRWAFQWRLRQTQTFWASRAVHTRTRLVFFLSYCHHVRCASRCSFYLLSPLWDSVLFVSNHSLTRQDCPASQTPTQAAHSSAYADKQTQVNRTKTCFLTFPSSLRLHLHTVTTLWHLSHQRPKRTTTGRTHTRPSVRWHLAQARQTESTKKKNTKNSSFLKAYSQQREPRGQRTNIKQ